MDDLSNELNYWYFQLNIIKQNLISIDPKLEILFNHVDLSGFKLHAIIKNSYPSLIAAIIGQKISYYKAKSLRGQLYSKYGTNFTPQNLKNEDLSFLGFTSSNIILNVTNHIIDNNIDLSIEENIRSLVKIKGIGNWTIETTLLTCLKNWDIFPLADKFIIKNMKRLYGPNVNINEISSKWSPYKSIVTWYLWRWF